MSILVPYRMASFLAHASALLRGGVGNAVLEPSLGNVSFRCAVAFLEIRSFGVTDLRCLAASRALTQEGGMKKPVQVS